MPCQAKAAQAAQRDETTQQIFVDNSYEFINNQYDMTMGRAIQFSPVLSGRKIERLMQKFVYFLGVLRLLVVIWYRSLL